MTRASEEDILPPHSLPDKTIICITQMGDTPYTEGTDNTALWFSVSEEKTGMEGWGYIHIPVMTETQE